MSLTTKGEIFVRPVKTTDAGEWLRLRQLLWPDINADFNAEIAQFFAGQAVHLVDVLVLDRGQNHLGGMIELNIRAYAEGSVQSQVPFVEGWVVDTDLRGQGYGRLLMAAAENWARQQGYTELASDVEVGNHPSIQAHERLGFKQVNRIVCLLKSLQE